MLARCDRITPEPFLKRRPGVKIVHDQTGDGRLAKVGKRVSIRYVGRLPDGTAILGTTDDPKTEQWWLGDDVVIRGITEAVTGMKAGGKRTVLIPPELHWGRKAYGGVIPENTILTFEIELVSVE